MESELMLAELQIKFSQEKEKAREQERRVLQLERDIKVKANKIEQLNSLLVKSEQKACDMV